MNDIQLFYVAVMVLFLTIYLIIAKICDTIAETAKYKAIGIKPITRIDCNNAQDFQKVISEINNAINEEEGNNEE